MTHNSPTVFAVWSIAVTLLGCFLVFHLWQFDRFRCLKWSNTAYSGAFKRLMTYTYFATIPLIMVYSYGFAYLKYSEGFISLDGNIMPKPYQLYTEEHKRLVFPFMMAFAVGWSFEMATHLEELCFWLFLIGAGPQQPDWFRSKYFRLWVIGSIVAFISVPVVTAAYRQDPLICEAHSILAGSTGDLILTLAFIPVLMQFPKFLRKVKSEGVDNSVVYRLHRFYEVNVLRVFFRFLFSVPLFTMAIDGVKPHTHKVNESLFWTDLFSIIACFGAVCSSSCTIIIFFPRSYEAEQNVEGASQHRSTNARSSWQSGVDFDQESHTERQSMDSYIATSSGSLKSQSRRLPRLAFNMRKNSAARPTDLPEQRRMTPSSRVGAQATSHLDRAGSVSSVAKDTDTETYLLSDVAKMASAQLSESYATRSQESIDMLDLEGTATPNSRKSDKDLISTSRAGITRVGQSLSGKTLQSPLVPAYYPPADDDSSANMQYKHKQSNSVPRILSGIPENPQTHMTMQQMEPRVYLDNDAHGIASNMPLRPNRRLPDPPTGGPPNARQLTAANIRQHDGRRSTVNPLIHHFISPIDFLEKHMVRRRFQHEYGETVV